MRSVTYSQRAVLRLLARAPSSAGAIRQCAAASAGTQGNNGVRRPEASPGMGMAVFGVAAASALGYHTFRKSGLECDVTTSTTTTTTTTTTTSTSASGARKAKAPIDVSGLTYKAKHDDNLLPDPAD